MEFLNTRLFPKNNGADQYQVTGIAARCDWVVLSDYKPPFCVLNKRTRNVPKTIFLSLRNMRAALPYFIAEVLPQLNSPFVLISGSEDVTLPNQVDKRWPPLSDAERGIFQVILHCPLLIHWFAENLDEQVSPKISPLPLGMVYPDSRQTEVENLPVAPLLGRPLKVLCAHRVRQGEQWQARKTVTDIALQHWQKFTTILTDEIPEDDFCHLLQQHAFVLCVHGGGIDPSPKAWQALYHGAIPIILSSTLDSVYAKLPTVRVSCWQPAVIDEAKLIDWRDKLAHYFAPGSGRNALLKHLSLDHWWQIINKKLLDYASTGLSDNAMKDTKPDTFYRSLYEAAMKDDDAMAAVNIVKRAAAENVKFPGFPGLGNLLQFLPRKQAAAVRQLLSDTWPTHFSSNKGAQNAAKVDSNAVADQPSKYSIFRSTLACAIAGRVDEALIQVNPLLAEGDVLFDGVKASDIPGYFASIPKIEQRHRKVIADDGSELIMSQPGINGITVLVFTGLADRVMVDVRVLDAFFAKRGYGSIALRDFSRSLYINGIESLATNRADTIAILKQKLAELDTRRLVCLGTSAGSFAAMSYGQALNAEQVVCFSPLTNVNHAFLNRHNDTRAKLFVKRINDTFKGNELDLLPLFENSSVSTTYTLYFGEGSILDKVQAEYLAHLPNVSLKPIKAVEQHNCILPLLLTGELESLLDFG